MTRLQHLAAGLSLAALSAWAWAAGDIVDTAYVEQALARGAIVWDARDADDYAAGHIPGAVNFGYVGTVLRDPNREDPLPVPAAEKLLGAAGVDPTAKEVIVYTRKGDSYSHYGLNLLKYYGAKDVKVYHGGIDDWRAAGKPVSKEATRLPPVPVKLTVREGVLLWNQDVIERVRAGNAQIVDTRTPKEFSGDDVRAVRGGHIPGAVNIPYEQNWKDPGTAGKLARGEAKTRDGMALKDEAELHKLYAKLDPNKETVVYCQSGARAAETANVLRALGFRDVKIYEASWIGYAGMISEPANNEVFVNVGALNARINTLEGTVRHLEEELARLKEQRK
jgi:thiosulfate/3-mercaptopyruvate sulfurtransferase